jgi:phosphoribosylformylglycinamidine synthase PurS subunit
MRALVHVMLKKTVLDPQGRAICSTLNGLGHQNVADVRQGKYFEIEVANGSSPDAVRQQIEKIAADVLANPVIEEFHIEVKD